MRIEVDAVAVAATTETPTAQAAKSDEPQRTTQVFRTTKLATISSGPLPWASVLSLEPGYSPLRPMISMR